MSRVNPACGHSALPKDASSAITVTAEPAPRPAVVNPAGPDGVEVSTAPVAWKTDTLPVSSINTRALSGAGDRAQANANLLAPPYFDPDGGQVVVPATAAGRDLAGQALSGIARWWVLVLVLLTAACAQDPGEPFDEPVRVVEGSPGQLSLTLHATGSSWGNSACTPVERGEVVESAAAITVKVTLRPTCQKTDEVGIGTGIDHAVPITLKTPLGRREVLGSAGREVLVCRPTGRSWVETYRQCLEGE
ncbi:hypothetical protein ACIBG8_09810 [Nonomuraea sp. NPDC050556]|uniref:hypothetical protein n=1 Tax=Nonomuraea sp. NPDC050556 TaxID=3364369 RepID=UPI003787FF1F